MPDAGLYDFDVPADRLRFALNSITKNVAQRLRMAVWLDSKSDRVEYLAHLESQYGPRARVELISELHRYARQR